MSSRPLISGFLPRSFPSLQFLCGRPEEFPTAWILPVALSQCWESPRLLLAGTAGINGENFGQGPECRPSANTNWEPIWFSQGEWLVSGAAVTRTWATESIRAAIHSRFLVPELRTLWVCFLIYVKDRLFLAQGHCKDSMGKTPFAASDPESVFFCCYCYYLLITKIALGRWFTSANFRLVIQRISAFCVA